MAPIIAVINRSTRVTDVQASIMSQAVNLQMANDFCPVWSFTPWTVKFYPRNATIPAGSYQIAILDNSDAPDALGYHDEMNGVPYGRVFAKTILDSGGSVLYNPQDPQMHRFTVSSVLSHEVLEVRADLNVSQLAWGPEIPEGSIYFYEVCDPVESDGYFKVVNGQKVVLSNFVYPDWFDPQSNARKLDHLGRSPGPFELAPGGYMIVMDYSGSGNYVFGSGRPVSPEKQSAKFHPMSRTVRRLGLHSPSVDKLFPMAQERIELWRKKHPKQKI
jgi:hypothetical protein